MTIKKTMIFDEVEMIYARLSREWPNAVKDLHIGNKQLYNLISLKRVFEEKHNSIQETVATIMRAHGATEDERGALKVSEENVPEVNKELFDLARQTIDIEGETVLIKEEDSIPSEIMEILYDFIEIE